MGKPKDNFQGAVPPARRTGGDKPISFSESLGWSLYSLLFPFTLKRFSFAATFWLAAHPIAGMLSFPKAESYLKDKGMDPALVKALCDDTTVRVRDRATPHGFMHSAVDLPSVFIPIHTARLITSPVPFYATKNILGVSKIIGNTGFITIDSPENFDFEGAKNAFLDVPLDLVENFPVSKHDFYWYIIFHEIRHLDNQNDLKAEPFMEYDSDTQAIRICEEVFGNEDIRDVVTYLRVFGNSDSHDTALCLDYERRGKPLPPMGAILAARQEINAFRDEYLVNGEDDDKFSRYCDAYTKVLENHRGALSELAVRRAELYIEAVGYFAPSQIKPTWAAQLQGGEQPAAVPENGPKINLLPFFQEWQRKIEIPAPH